MAPLLLSKHPAPAVIVTEKSDARFLFVPVHQHTSGRDQRGDLKNDTQKSNTEYHTFKETFPN